MRSATTPRRALFALGLSAFTFSLIGLAAYAFVQDESRPRLGAAQRNAPLIQRALNAARKSREAPREIGFQPPMLGSQAWSALISSDEEISLGISQITGLVPPPNLPQLVVETDAAARAVEARLEAERPRALVLGARASFGAARRRADADRFSWRHPELNVVTPARDQGETNACWSFATIAAFESAFGIENGLTGPRLRAFSEQAIINCSGAGTAARGGWWAFAYLRDYGAVPYDEVPYTGQDPIGIAPNCRQVTRFRAVNLNYVDPDQQRALYPDRAKIKAALVEHGPVAAGVFATDRFMSHQGTGVFQETGGYDTRTGANHAIVIVGWNDNVNNSGKGAWIVKNSYGDLWGYQGFGFVAYESNNIGFGAAWVAAASTDPTLGEWQLGAMRAVFPSALPAPDGEAAAVPASDVPGPPPQSPYLEGENDLPGGTETARAAERRETPAKGEDPLSRGAGVLTQPRLPNPNPAAEKRE